MWNSAAKKRAKNRLRKLNASPCAKRNGVTSSRETTFIGTGRNLDSHIPNGSTATAAVIHQAPWSSPDCSGVRPRSSDMNGRNMPRTNDDSLRLLIWRW